jgi:hypothetical protein
MKLQRIDKLTRPEHSFVAPADDCFFLHEYIAGAGCEHGEANNLIMSLLLIQATYRTYSAHPVQSAEADPGAGNSLVLGPAREVASWTNPLSIIESIHRERSVHVFMMDASHGRVHRCRAKALAHPEIDVGTCSISILFIRMMWVSTDIDISWPSDNVAAMLRLRTVAVVCLPAPSPSCVLPLLRW